MLKYLRQPVSGENKLITSYDGVCPLNFHYLIFICIFYMTINLLSGLMVYKLIRVYHFIEPGGIFVFPLMYFITNVVTEVYGYRISRHLIWAGNICSVIFVVLAYFIIRAPSPQFWHYQNAFDQIFGFMPRVLIAGLLGNTCGLFLNIYLVSKLKLKLQGKHYWFRSLISTMLGEMSYTIIAPSIMYIGWMPTTKILELMVSIFIFKVIYSIAANPIECLCAFFLKKRERANIYDHDTNFSPFKFELNIKSNQKPALRIV